MPAICVTASPGHSPRFEGAMPTNFPRLEPSPSHVSANTWRLRSDSAGSVATLVGGAPGPGAGPQLGVSPSRAAHTRSGLVLEVISTFQYLFCRYLTNDEDEDDWC